MPRTRPRRGLLAAAGDHLLTALAVVGSLCIVLVLVGWIFDVSLMMFRTGSMSPTIPAGSVAVVREIPATEMSVGDVVTVERGQGMLPVTHRVVALEEVDDVTGEVTFVMRGDANEVQDPDPYTATEVRCVMFSVPGAARVVQWFGDPYVLGALTLGATALVIWAFWPRAHEPGNGPEEPQQVAGETDNDQDQRAHRQTGAREQPPRTAHSAAIPLLASLLLAAPGADTALVTGEHLRMRTTGDPAQMQNLSPGRAVTWEVGVWADAPDPGEIRLGISGRGELARLPGALTVTVRACDAPWNGERCPSGSELLLAPRSLDTISQASPSLRLTTMPSDEQRWLRIDVVLEDVRGAEGSEGDVLIHAVGEGEELTVSPDPPPGDATPGGEAPGEDVPGEEPPGGEAPGGAAPSPGHEAAPEDLLARTGAVGVWPLAALGLLAAAAGVVLRGSKRGKEDA